MLYGCRLNRITRVSASACNVKPLSNLVEATITRETGGSQRSKQLSNVFVVDTNKQPLNTIHPGEARLLLNRGKAAVLKRYPFTIILKVAIDDPVVAELRIKIDPGSKTTGIAIVNDQLEKSFLLLNSRTGDSKSNQILTIDEVCVEADATDIPDTESHVGRTTQQEEGLVTAVFAKQDIQCHHLGTAVCKSLSYHKYQHGIGQIRYAAHGEC